MPSQLELDFHEAMVNIYHRANKEADYNATRFIQMVSAHGGRDAAKSLINADSPSEGYTELWKRGRLYLTVEALVIDNPTWHPLFDPQELARAKARLVSYGYV